LSQSDKGMVRGAISPHDCSVRIWSRRKAGRCALAMAACGILVTSVGTGHAQGFVAGDGSPRAATAPKPFASTITVTTSGKTTGAMTSHYLGLSFESTGLNAGNFDTGGNLPQLLKNLGAGTMRFGGLSVDNDIVSYPQWTGITTRGLAGLARLAKASGWTVFYSEDLADFPADKVQVTADAARVAAGLGSRLAAIGCGNEPHGYIRYGRRPPASRWRSGARRLRRRCSG
jgi:hypothetical protein